MKKRDIVPNGEVEGVMPYEPVIDSPEYEPESDSEAERRGPDENWIFWDNQIRAALIHERRWRHEAQDCEAAYFGEDHSKPTASETIRSNKIDDKVAMIHANIDVLKPLLFSETPQPVVRRRFRGDGKTDQTDLMAAEAGQRLAQFLVETEKFDKTMIRVRDDWLIAGRGAARVHYRADIQDMEIVDPQTQAVMTLPVKMDERVTPQGVHWRSLLLAPANSWEQTPWIAFEIPTTRSTVQSRFGKEVAERMSFSRQGLIHAVDAINEEQQAHSVLSDDTSTGKAAVSPFDTVTIWEIWSRETKEVIWFCPEYPDSILDREDDPLGLEEFWPTPEPICATTRGDTLTPRPDIKYYERRAMEVQRASQKLATILDTLSVSGLFPGKMADEVKKLLKGENLMIPVEAWQGFIEKGGSQNLIQWLPVDMLIAVAQALITMREQAKQAMFEASGVSDVMRAQGDPNETATAQQIKGRYAGMRLSERQRRISFYARDLLRLMVEIGLEHFDTERLAEICGLDLPMTEMEREQIIAHQQMLQQEFQRLSQLHAQMAQAVEVGMMQGPVPPAPEPPKEEHIPETSWELVHERLRSDIGRKITINIETQSTILVDEQADKEARVEFLQAFASFVQQLTPMMNTGQFDGKTVKELLMFGIRGFPKSRTLEGLISALPDEPQTEPQEDTSITVAKIKAQVDTEIEKMRLEDSERDRQHERQMKGVDVMTDAVKTAAEANTPPTPQGA